MFSARSPNDRPRGCVYLPLIYYYHSQNTVQEWVNAKRTIITRARFFLVSDNRKTACMSPIFPKLPRTTPAYYDHAAYFNQSFPSSSNYFGVSTFFVVLLVSPYYRKRVCSAPFGVGLFILTDFELALRARFIIIER